MRDNCLSTWPKLYCGATTSICQKMKDLGFPCGNDRECYSVGLIHSHIGPILIIVVFTVSNTVVSVKVSVVSLRVFLQR